MDFGNLSAFVAAYDCGSISKAAVQLYMSPQGLSKSIAKLEGEIGAQLFVRSHQGIVPTKYARAIYPKVKDLLDTLEGVHATANATETYFSLDVALANGMMAYLGLDFIRSFEAANPGVELRVDEYANDGVEARLLSGESEVGFLVGPVDEARFTTTFLMSVPHVLFVSDQSHLAQKKSVSFTDLADHTVFTLSGDYPVKRNLQERLAAAGSVPSAIIGTCGADTILPSVIRNEAYLVSAAIWARMSEKAGLCILPFEDASFAWNVFLAHRRGAALSDPARAFVQHVLEWRGPLQS